MALGKHPAGSARLGGSRGKAFPRQTPSRGNLQISRRRLEGRCGETGLWGIPGARAGARARPPLETESRQVWLEFRSVTQKLPHRGSRGREPRDGFQFKSLKALLGSQQPALARHSVQTGQDGSLINGPRHPLNEGSTVRVTENIGGVGNAPGLLLRRSQIPDGNVSSHRLSPFLSAFAPFPTNSRKAGGPQLWGNSGQWLERRKMPMQRSGCGARKMKQRNEAKS